MIRVNLAAGLAGLGEFVHLRVPSPVDQQTVIRQNRDTLYSGLILDLSSPAMVTLPDAEGRFMSMQVVNQDHYMWVETKPGTYDLTEDKVGTRFAVVIVRTFVNPNDNDDVAKANALQDRLKVSSGGRGQFEAPDWDQDDLRKARQALNELATMGFDYSNAFGRREEVRPIDHLVGAATGWGGQPNSAAEYQVASVDQNDGDVPFAVTVKDVPVDAFWSVTVYNAEGYLEPNDLGIYSLNNVTAQPNDDDSYTIHFGGCNDGRVNCIPISPGWNYAVRMYLPRKEILEGRWEFPVPQPTN